VGEEVGVRGHLHGEGRGAVRDLVVEGGAGGVEGLERGGLGGVDGGVAGVRIMGSDVGGERGEI
jgi:hypothetical protein